MPKFTVLAYFPQDYGVREPIEADNPEAAVREMARRLDETSLWDRQRMLDDCIGETRYFVEGEGVCLEGLDGTGKPATRRVEVTVWVLNACVPGEPDPVLPEVFGSEADAEAGADKMLRAEWESNTPEDDDGNPRPYPESWDEANRQLADYHGNEWGRWELTQHTFEIEVPS